ncbi:MAG: hypothetical protein OXE99_07540 [Cellvibrionales bacterium]|nr:hypothetical protein [Cellvibrionales bacterium]
MKNSPSLLIDRFILKKQGQSIFWQKPKAIFRSALKCLVLLDRYTMTIVVGLELAIIPPTSFVYIAFNLIR